MSTASTSLVNIADNTKTIPTLTGTNLTDSTFEVDRWGYKKNRNTDNYNPFPATSTLLENNTRTNADAANMRFATKIDYLQESGTYKTTINFNAVANPLYPIMQEVTASMCRELASDNNIIVLDRRDNQEYTVRYINGNCWMTKNLAIGCNGSGSNYGDAITPIQLTSSDSNISAATWTTPTNSLALGDSYGDPRLECSSTHGAWYNYAATTAGTITGSSNTTDATYDICPKGWKLPTYSEQSTVLSYPSEFAVTKSGFWYHGSSDGYMNEGYWWSSTTATTASYRAIRRWGLLYNWGVADRFQTYQLDNRSGGAAVRCVANS